MQLDDTTLSVVKRLIREQGRRYAPRYAVAFAFMAVFAACTALTAWMMKDVINQIFVDRDVQALYWIPIVIAVAFMVKGVAAYFQEVTLARIGNRIVAEMQERLFDHVLKMDLGFFQRKTSGDLVTRLTHNVRAVREMMHLLATGLGRDLFTLAGLIGVMVTLEPVLSAISLIGAPVAVVGLRRLTRRIKAAAKSENVAMAALVTQTREASQGIRIVKSFQLEDVMRKRMQEAVSGIERLNNRIIAVQASVNPLMETVGGLAVAGVVYYAGWRALSQGQAPGEFFAFATALLMAADPMRRLSRLQLQLTTCAVRVRMLYKLLGTPAPEGETEQKPPLVLAGGEIRFDKVSFAYSKGTPVLRDLSLTVPAGATTALVGLSGSGKTTMFNLIQRFWLPAKGAILIDGQSIADVSLASLRSQVAFVSQDAFLFEGTIRDNISSGQANCSAEAIVAAARAAHADEFIRNLPQGYDTPVGELGGQISGGQKQRISIARAFLKNAPIILMDEPTSALDSETEHHIQSALTELTRGRTTIIIAHRLATIAKADMIHVLEAGKLIESGTQGELVRQGGLYAKLHRMQSVHVDA